MKKLKTKESRSLSSAGLMIGIGMGGFIDGILFHQIFQLHNMLSNQLFPDTVAKIEINMFWDGIFHLFTWLTTAAGITVLWRATQQQTVPLDGREFVGSIVMGWGCFNLVEGLINHHILQVHHVVERATGRTQMVWDLTFLGSGVALILIGMYLRRAFVTAKLSPLHDQV